MPQWTHDQWQELVSHVVYNRALGVEFADLASTGVVLRIRYRADLVASIDDETLNDGAIAAMVDAALGFSVHRAMPDDRSLATLDMRIDRLRLPLPRRDVFCRATCLGHDEHVAWSRGEIYHDRPDEPFAIAVGTIMFIPAESWMRGVQGLS